MNYAQLANLPENLTSLTVEKRDGTGIITLNRAKEHNPLSEALIFELAGVLNALEADGELHAVVLTGAGKSFCAGALLGEVVHPDGVDSERQLILVRGFNQLAQRIRNLDLPVIAAVNGNAVGGGAALALSCDIAVAAESANYFFAFGRVGGASCDIGCSYLLPRIVGAMRARHWMLTGKRVSAREGVEHGLFVDVVPDGQVLDAALEIAAQIKVATPRRAAAATKLATARAETTDFDTCIGYEAYVQNYLFTTKDHQDRLRALMANLEMM